MDYIKGKYTKKIFSSEKGYVIGLFKIQDASNKLKDLIKKTITFTGLFVEINSDDIYILYGNYILNERYGMQFKVDNYEKVEPVGKDQVIDFLSSSFIKGCGEATAEKIVATLGENAIKLIKDDKNNLYKIKGLTENKINSIYNSIIHYYNYNELIMYMKNLGFSSNEITKIINIYGSNSKKIIENNLYALIDIVDFKKLDKIFFKIYDETNDMRILACIIQSMKELTFDSGDIYLYKEEIYKYMIYQFGIDLYDLFDSYINKLIDDKQIILIGDNYYLKDYYNDEKYIANCLIKINNLKNTRINKFDEIINSIQRQYDITYDESQKKAIKSALTNPITIITGGPGTGKTTIINGILRIYKEYNKITYDEMIREVTLLAPTGRASKRMQESTNFPASTIHRYLKWNHDDNTFAINEYNPISQKLLIIDETSMIDNNLFASLLKGINHNLKLVLVGDDNQLPSVSPGNILHDLIDSKLFNHIELKRIYRQSENSFIPILANEIKNMNIESNLLEKKDDYNFIECDSKDVKKYIKKIIEMSIAKGMPSSSIQILAPMYKGENGIDNLNILLQSIINPPDLLKNEITIGPVIYRTNDRVINLVNNTDLNIFNGDIGIIKDINKNDSSNFLIINFYGNDVTIKREDINTIKLAYALTIHKSQGSEFNNVIMPVTKEYTRMLYNRLIYTGISRAKKSLILIGDLEAFQYAINNTYSKLRKTTIKDMLLDNKKIIS